MAGRAFLAIVQVEPAAVKIVVFIFVTAHIWQYPKQSIVGATLILVVLVSTPVEESAKMSVMAVEIAAHMNLDLAAHHLHHLQGVEDLGMQKAVCAVPLPIQVAAELTAPVIAPDYAIDIQHGHNSKDEVLSERCSLWR
jgi:hypothetical protein